MSQHEPNVADPDRTTVQSSWDQLLEGLFLTANRGVVAVAIAAGFAGFLFAVTLLRLVPLTNVQALFYAYSSLIAGNLTLITVVVSINQLLLARELQTPDELQTEIEGVMDYRASVEDATGTVAPVKPLGFLQVLLEGTREEAQRLGGLANDGAGTQEYEDIDCVVTRLTEQLDQVDRLLDESETGTFSVLSLMLETNYAEQINELRTIRAAHESTFPAEVNVTIDALVDRLQEIDIARQYFKSIYMQQELSALSRVLLYAGLPAVVVSIATLLALTVSTDQPAAVPYLRLVVPVTLTIGLFPLSVLCSFFLRTATVTRLTAATLPFTTPEQER